MIAGFTIFLLTSCLRTGSVVPVVWIDSPLDGSVVEARDTISVVAHASSEEGVSEIQLFVDGVQIRTRDYSGSEGTFVELREEWSADPGEYALQVRAVSMNGTISAPAVAYVKVIGRESLTQLEETGIPEESVTKDTTLSLEEPTPTPTGTSYPSVGIDFRVDKSSILQGSCTTLRWEVENAISVALDGTGVGFEGNKQVCPGTTTSYYLHVEAASESADRSVQVEVQVPAPTPTKTVEPTPTEDSQPPEISGITESDDPIRPPSCSPGSVTISAVITDPSGVPKHDLYYRVVSGSSEGAWVWRSMTDAGGDVYQTTIGHDQLQSSLFPYEGSNTVLQYYIKAWDSETNMAQSTTGEVVVVFCVP